MSPGADTPPGRVIEFGSDLVVETPDALIILASRPMDWPVREFQRVPVFVFGEKYLIRSRSPAQPPHAMRYELIPWPEHLHEESNESVNYTL